MIRPGCGRITAVAAAALAAAALSPGAGSAPAPRAYTCTGTASVDRPRLQGLIDAGGAIVLHGPRACVGNFVATGVSVAIRGAGPGATMDGGGTGSVLIADGATVTLSKLTLTHGKGSGPDDPGEVSGAYGGAVSAADSSLTVVGCRIVGNDAPEQGGGIHAAESRVTVIDSMISGNTSQEGGGGVDTEEDVDLTIADSTVANNSTGPHGGGIEAFDGSLTVTDSRISGNRVTDTSGFRSGGGIWAGLADVSIGRSLVWGNRSTEFGGGIGYSGGAGVSLTITDSIVARNAAALGGGGIRDDAYYGDGVLVVGRSIVARNTAGQGGGIDAFGVNGFTAKVSLDSSLVAGNRAETLGGGIDSFIDASGGATSITVASTTIGAWPGRRSSGNRAAFGGGIAANGANGSASITLASDAELVGNVAVFEGGGVFTRNGVTLVAQPGVVMRQNRPDNVS